ncbi:MAG TPA: GNAT family N-acetyltransferase [Stellaceae bacterium]|nr:GNAT family N-acetyltransferase [Stellaceae bacterium]
MLLRPADERDIPRLQEIEKAARARYATIDELSFAVKTPPIAADRLAQGDVVLAEEDDRVVGFVLTQAMDGMLYIANIAVEIGFSGRGIGAALVAAADKQARSKDLPSLILTTFKTPRWNGPWFRKLGFEPMPEDLVGPGLRAVLDRHRQFLDMRIRETLWRAVAGAGAPPRRY